MANTCEFPRLALTIDVVVFTLDEKGLQVIRSLKKMSRTALRSPV